MSFITSWRMENDQKEKKIFDFYGTFRVSVRRHVRDQSHNRWSWPGVSRAASMSLSNQGIHCCLGSGYSLAMGPHPALLAVRCSLELLANVRFLDMDIKRIRLEKRADECRGLGGGGNNPKNHSSTTTICLEADRMCALGRRATPR